MSESTSVLFVCLGNICRSPLAEAIFLEMARSRGLLDRLEVDSAGTGHWHVGERADPRTLEVAQRYGIEVPSIGRQLTADEMERWDYILVMDRSNKRNVLALGAPPERVRLMRSFDPELQGASEKDMDVPDPYWGEGDGFERVYQMLLRACEGLLGEIESQMGGLWR